MATTTPTTLPIISFDVDQSFFVESLGGPWNSQNYLNRFPDSVYNKAVDSHLVNFLYGLLGPVGVGLLRQEYMEARLQIEEAQINGANLDALYSSPFQFARLAEETYTLDADASILPSDQRAEILSSDASFRNRAQQWLGAIRAGGTNLGLTLAASSGLGQPVEVVENYKAIYDQFCDIPLGIPYLGQSASLNEIILVPRNDVARNSLESFSFIGEPTSGFFTITIPVGPPYVAITATSTSTTTVTVDNPTQVSAGCFMTFVQAPFVPPLTSADSPLYGIVTSVIDDTVTVTFQTGALTNNTSYIAFVGNAQTAPLPYNATYDQIESAIQVLPVCGSGVNTIISGGPLPDVPIGVSFAGQLANIPIAPLIINVDADAVTGVGFAAGTPIMADNEGHNDIAYSVVDSIVDTSADQSIIQFAPGDVQTMLYAVDILRPVTSFVTTNIGQSLTLRQPANATASSSTNTEVLRYVSGNINVPWPQADGITNWIEGGIEHEAPAAATNLSGQYVNFHNIVNIISYTGAALEDAHYENPAGSPYSPWYLKYYDVHTGPFNAAQVALFPFLGQYQGEGYQFIPNYAANTQPDRPTVTNSVSGTSIINNSYPVSYVGLPGVNQQPVAPGQFWASDEVTSGADYLEIDLGTPQAINYLYFEATDKPFIIDIAYDLLDQSPQRVFFPATIGANSVTSLSFQASSTSPWTACTIYLTNALDQMIYTRFIRIGFTRNPSGPPFELSGIPQIIVPYSIEVRNLRVGRNVNNTST